MNFGSTNLIKPTWYCSYYSKLKKKKKKERRQSGLTKWHCRCIAQKHCMHIRAVIYKKKEHKSMIEKKNEKKRSTY